MNDAVNLTWVDMVMESWHVGDVSLGITLILMLVGIRGIWRPFKTSTSHCQAYTLLSLLPVVIGVLGGDYLLEVFRDMSGHLRREALTKFVGAGEAAMPLMVGCLGSCALMITASILWIRSKNTAT